jgi:predicted nuclease with TOPRIM domain
MSEHYSGTNPLSLERQLAEAQECSTRNRENADRNFQLACAAQKELADVKLNRDLLQSIVKIGNEQDNPLHKRIGELTDQLAECQKQNAKVNEFRERLRSKYQRLSDQYAEMRAQIVALKGESRSAAIREQTIRECAQVCREIANSYPENLKPAPNLCHEIERRILALLEKK